ncbi:unnamed protein product, partial [Ectocarpus sp. 13 AM-2016]
CFRGRGEGESEAGIRRAQPIPGCEVLTCVRRNSSMVRLIVRLEQYSVRYQRCLWVSVEQHCKNCKTSTDQNEVPARTKGTLTVHERITLSLR